MPSDKILQEADRVMVICNACRYCEGFCAVFPAMERRRTFEDRDLKYLANLCHNCRDCYYACQYAPPHEYQLNVPRALAELRLETYRVLLKTLSTR
jgi:citrate/tricarballylate utilization protein